METTTKPNKSTFIGREIEHNKKVKYRLQQISDEFNSATSAEELISTLKSYPADFSLIYKSGIMWLTFGLTAVLISAATYLMLAEVVSGWITVAIFVTASAPLLLAVVYGLKYSQRNELLKSLFYKYEEIKYGFIYNSDQRSISFADSKAHFKGAFSRGNHKNSIPIHASGTKSLDERELSYSIFQYRFVNRTRHTKNIKQRSAYHGFKKTKTIHYNVYDIHNQWGIFVSGVKAPTFSINSFGKSYYQNIWTTSDDMFNEQYSISADNEIEIAKMLQPSNVLMLEKVLDSIPKAGGKVITKTKSNHNTYNYHPPLKSTELIAVKDPGLLYWSFGMDLFKRTSNKKPEFINPIVLSEYLESIELINIDYLFKAIDPLFKKVIK